MTDSNHSTADRQAERVAMESRLRLFEIECKGKSVKWIAQRLLEAYRRMDKSPGALVGLHTPADEFYVFLITEMFTDKGEDMREKTGIALGQIATDKTPDLPRHLSAYEAPPYPWVMASLFDLRAGGGLHGGGGSSDAG